jgi:hypothetical protein
MCAERILAVELEALQPLRLLVVADKEATLELT